MSQAHPPKGSLKKQEEPSSPVSPGTLAKRQLRIDTEAKEKASAAPKKHPLQSPAVKGISQGRNPLQSPHPTGGFTVPEGQRPSDPTMNETRFPLQSPKPQELSPPTKK